MASTFVNYYDVIGVPNTASTSEIAQAYRKKARFVHPDRNPDDPLAHEKFQKLSKAYEILSDDKAKEAFDAVLRNKLKAKERDSQMSDKRRQMKETLLERERQYMTQKAEEEQAERRLQAEIERIKRDAKKRKQEEVERMEEERVRKDNIGKRAKTEPPRPTQTHQPQQTYDTSDEYHEQLERQTLELMRKAAEVMKQQAANP